MMQDRFWILLAKKIAGEATESELVELENIMRLYPELINSAKQIQNIWEAPLHDHSDASKKAFVEHINKMNNAGIDISIWQKEEKDRNIKFKKKTSLRKKRRFVELAAACVVTIFAITIFLNVVTKQVSAGNEIVNEVSTQSGSRSKHVLPDGSTVWLNAGSKLSYEKNFGTSGRHVHLEGEGFFDVVKMEHVPFIIQTKVIQVKVLGTVLNVKSYGDDPTTETTLVKGKVEITLNKRPGDKYILLPNNKLVVANGYAEKKILIDKEWKKLPLVSLQELTYYERDSTIVETSWKENRLVFQDESFEAIARKLERWFNVKIVFSNPKLQGERLTGSFTDETIIQALEALKITTDFDYRIEQNEIRLTGKLSTHGN